MDYSTVFELDAGEIIRISTSCDSKNFIKTAPHTVREIIVQTDALTLGDTVDLSDVLKQDNILAIEVYEEEKLLIKNILFKLLFLYELQYDSLQATNLIKELKIILKK